MASYPKISHRSPYGECARCGFIYRVNKIVKEWSGFRVCKGPGTNDCWDPKPRELRPPKVKPEGVPVHNASPQTEPVYGRHNDGSHL